MWKWVVQKKFGLSRDCEKNFEWKSEETVDLPEVEGENTGRCLSIDSYVNKNMYNIQGRNQLRRNVTRVNGSWKYFLLRYMMKQGMQILVNLIDERLKVNQHFTVLDCNMCGSLHCWTSWCLHMWMCKSLFWICLFVDSISYFF